MKYTIPTYKLKVVCKKLEILNRRIDGMNGQRIEYTVGVGYEKTIKEIDKNNIVKEKLVEVVDIDMTNPVVSLNGWSFLAIIEHSKDGNVIMKKIYDVNVPEKYWNSDTYCEHCNTDRYRKYTYLVYRADTKEIHQVGSTCLTAYLGFDATLLMQHATFMDKLNNIMDSEHDRLCHRGIEVQPMETFLKRTIADVSLHGYVSAKKAREYNTTQKEDGNFLTATGEIVWSMMYNRYAYESIKDADMDMVKETYPKIIEWVKNLTNNTDYTRNIQTLIEREYITYKTATTASSIVGMYYADMNKNNKANTIHSEWVGEIKRRIDFDLTLKFKNVFEGKYGINYCYVFETVEGNRVVWFTNSVELEVGCRYIGKATVTKHDEFKGVKQTIVNRAKLTKAE